MRTTLLTVCTVLAAALLFTAFRKPTPPRTRRIHRANSRRPTAAKSFKTPADLAFDQVLAEPIVRQPVSLSFDERGRLWVVQYITYPHPAGLKVLSRDMFWRVVYDKVPPPPPNHLPGLDRVTIHEDTKGDGVFDKHTTILEGLNIVTSVARGRGGVFVLNPPYLLFYPTRDNADRPTGDPVVHLQGFASKTPTPVPTACAGGRTVGSTAPMAARSAPHHAAGGQGPDRTHGRPAHLALSPREEAFRDLRRRRRQRLRRRDRQRRPGLLRAQRRRHARLPTTSRAALIARASRSMALLANPYSFGFFEAMKHNKAQRFSHTYAIQRKPPVCRPNTWASCSPSSRCRAG